MPPVSAPPILLTPMATLVSFHAHPDDEAIAVGGTIARASDAGHQVIVVFATRGEHGEVDAGVLATGEELWERRVRECERAGEILGYEPAFLGFVDSGMMGTPENEAPDSFWQADVEEAAGRLAAILQESDADVLTIYDEHGGYGHPDHIQVHRVGARAAEFAGTPRVYEATQNRDQIRRSIHRAREAGIDIPGDIDPDALDGFGSPESLLTTAVDVTAFLDRKRAAMAAHASQISDTSLFLAMPPEMFVEAFGTEWFIRRGWPPGIAEDDLLAGLD
jgi:LmbE family N-acetylglucosaminyl deacetylase